MRRHRLLEEASPKGATSFGRGSSAPKRAERCPLDQQEDGQDGQVPGGAPHHQHVGLSVVERGQIDQRARVHGGAERWVSPPPPAAAAVQHPPDEQSAQRGKLQRQTGQFVLSVEGGGRVELRADLCHTGQETLCDT